MAQADDVLRFWLDECGPDSWFKQDPELDARILERFLDTWEGAKERRYSLWLTYATGALAYIIVTDQFSRNILRGNAASFSMDRAALSAAKSAIAKGWDMQVNEPARQFFYLPLMHSESLSDQDRCVRLMLERMPQSGASNLLHARAHRDVIRRFGRFPTRNADLSRDSTAAEAAFVADHGYAKILQDLQRESKAA